jgi:hypothetical protein
VSIRAYDSKNPTADSYSSDVAEGDQTFNAIFKAENLKLIPNDYTVSVSSKGISKFESDKITYWIALEQTSVYG